MKNMWKVSWKVIVTLIATVGALIMLEAILTPFLRHQQIQLMVKIVADCLMAGIPLLLCIKLFKLKKDNLGLTDATKFSHFGVGALWGLGLILSQIGLMFIFGGIELIGLQFSIGSLLIAAMLALTVSLGEEVLFRGALQGIVRQTYGPWAGLLVSSCLFFLLHGTNPGMFESVYAPINLFLAGFLMSLLRERTGTIWIPVGLHWTWNLTQELSGFATSGFSSTHAILQTQLVSGKEWANGGSFGIEGSLISLIVMSAACLLLIAGGRRKNSNMIKM